MADAISSETVNRIANDAQLQANIDAESAKRAEVDGQLGAAINAETARAQAVEHELATAINNEAERSQLKDIEHDTKLQHITADANGTYIKGDTYFNKDNQNQVLINKDGIKVGQNSVDINYNSIKVTDSGKTTEITSTDVSIVDPKYSGNRINLSDLGQVDNIDIELKARPEYTGYQTAVGGINAEAAIRREEVARLDNRVDQVNDRLDKVGAMSAAIANLRTMGYDPAAPSEFAMSVGQYRDQTGMAVGFFHYPHKDFMLSLSVSGAGDEYMGGIGATWKFGHRSPERLAEIEKSKAAKAKLEKALAEKKAKEARENAAAAAQSARHAKMIK